MDEPLSWRNEFRILHSATCLISSSLGAMPRGVCGQMKERTGPWATRGVRACPERWQGMTANVADRIGEPIGAAPMPARQAPPRNGNASAGWTILAGCARILLKDTKWGGQT